jgi:hypothetical protein
VGEGESAQVHDKEGGMTILRIILMLAAIVHTVWLVARGNRPFSTAAGPARIA